MFYAILHVLKKITTNNTFITKNITNWCAPYKKYGVVTGIFPDFIILDLPVAGIVAVRFY